MHMLRSRVMLWIGSLALVLAGALALMGSAVYPLPTGLSLAIVTETSAYTTTSADYTVSCNTTAVGAFTVKLDASPLKGEIHNVVLTVGTNTLTISGNGQNIYLNGSLVSSMTTATAGTSFTYQYDGTEWVII